MDRQNLSGSGCNYAKQEFNTCCETGSQEEESKVLLAVWNPVSNKTFPWIIDWVKAIVVPTGNTWKFFSRCQNVTQGAILSYSVNIKCQNSTCSDYLSFFYKHKQQSSTVTLAPSYFLSRSV